MSTSRHHWSWRSCFALVKHNKKSKKQPPQPANSQKLTSPAPAHAKAPQTVDENANLLAPSVENATDTKNDAHLESETTLSMASDPYMLPSSCIIRIDTPSDDESDSHLIDGDCIQQIDSSSSIRPTHLDAIVEDSNEESSDELEETMQPCRLCCDRDIVDDANSLHSRLFDLSRMNHVKSQFSENGNLLSEFSRQLEKLKVKINDILRASAQMPRDAELLEARYSSLSATIESLSILLKIAQIPACRLLLNRLELAIDQRIDQLTKLVQLTSMSLHNIQQRFDLCDDDFSSFRSALSSYEHLFTTSA